MIPEFTELGYLPAGVYDATLVEIENRFAYNKTRKRLFEAMVKVVNMFREAKSPEIFLDGSYITTKPEPGDYDLCWEPSGVEPTDELLEFFSTKVDRKKIYLGDIFPRFPQPPYYVDHFVEWQSDVEGAPKGLIRIIEKYDD